MKEIKFEIFVTMVYLTLPILSIILIGVHDIKELLFTLVMIIEIPFIYYGSKIVRKIGYQLFRKEGIYEN